MNQTSRSSGPILMRLAVLSWAVLAAMPSLGADPADPAGQDVRVNVVTHFGFDRAALTALDQGALLADVGKMRDVSWQEVVVTGHTDAIGADDYNLPLSRQRAEAVKRFLVAKGLAPEMVRTEGKGEAAPVATNDTAEGRGRNRRAEVEFRGVRAVASR